MLYFASWSGVTITVFIDDERQKERAEKFLGLEMKPASDRKTAEISMRRLARGWGFSAPIGPSFLEHDDDALILLTMLKTKLSVSCCVIGIVAERATESRSMHEETSVEAGR